VHCTSGEGNYQNAHESLADAAVCDCGYTVGATGLNTFLVCTFLEIYLTSTISNLNGNFQQL
jgi:hypothetical protein